MSRVVTERGWGSRIKGSIAGMFVGIILFIAGFPVLYKNEQFSVRNIRTIDQARKTAVTVDPANPDPAQEGKLVHFSGETATEGALRDPEFGVSAPAVRLVREVEMYQWFERKRTETKEKLGGGETTTTTYTYEKKWGRGREESENFRDRGHDNPQPAYPAWSDEADRVSVKSLVLSGNLVSQFHNQRTLPVKPADLPAELSGKFKGLPDGRLYLGANPESPAVGDLRIQFIQHPNGPVSVIARKSGSGLGPAESKAGLGIEWLYNGTLGIAEMCARKTQENNLRTWLFRLGGFLCMFVGLALFLNPLKVFASVLPIAGRIVGFGTGVISGIVSVCLAVITICVSWIAVRPLAAIPAVVALVLLILTLRRKKEEPDTVMAGMMPPPPPPPPR